MKSLSPTVQEIKQILKLTTDKQTDRTKRYANDNSIWGHKNHICELMMTPSSKERDVFS